MIKIFIFITSFSFYLSTVSPTVFWGTSPEISVVSYFLTLSSPSGYPILLVLGKLFTYLPVGDVAFRINIFNSFIGGLSVLLFFAIFSKISTKFFKYNIKSISVCITFCFAFSYSIWWFVNLDSKFILQIFFAHLSLLLFLNGHFGNFRNLLLLFFSISLGLSNHTSYLIFALLLFVFILMKIRKIPSFKKNFLIGLFLLLLPLNLFILIPIRDMDSIVSKSPQDFIKYIKRDDINIFNTIIYKYPKKGIKKIFADKDYFVSIGEKEKFFGDSNGILGKIKINKIIFQTIISLYSLFREYNIFSILSIIGLYFLWRKSKGLFLFTLFWFFSYFLIPILYLNLYTWNLPYYHKCTSLKIIPYSIWFGCGLLFFYQLFEKNKYLSYLQKFLLIMMILLPIFIFKTHQPLLDNSQNIDARKFSETIFFTLPQKSILLINDTDVFSVLKYLQLVEKRREDVTLIGKHYLINYWVQDSLIKKGVLDKRYNIQVSGENSYKGISDIVREIIASNENVFAIYEHPMTYFYKREKLPEKLCFRINSMKDFNIEKFEKD